MNTKKLVTITLAAAALSLLTAVALLAAPVEPGKELQKLLNNAPIPVNSNLKAHSEAWNDRYFDKYTSAQPVLHAPQVPQEKWQGGIAEQQAEYGLPAVVPQHRNAGAKAHSEAWNDYYMDRYVNSRLPLHTDSYTAPYKWQGGSAKGAQAQWQ